MLSGFAVVSVTSETSVVSNVSWEVVVRYVVPIGSSDVWDDNKVATVSEFIFEKRLKLQLTFGLNLLIKAILSSELSEKWDLPVDFDGFVASLIVELADVSVAVKVDWILDDGPMVNRDAFVASGEVTNSVEVVEVTCSVEGSEVTRSVEGSEVTGTVGST